MIKVYSLIKGFWKVWALCGCSSGDCQKGDPHTYFLHDGDPQTGEIQTKHNNQVQA